MQKSDLSFIFKSFLVWKVGLIIAVFFAIKFIPLQKDFLGGGMANYLTNPFLWSWANFDGEHYLAIAREGYLPLTYFFFPLYPIVIRFFSLIFGQSILNYLISGLFVSHVSLFLGMIGFYKLTGLDYRSSVSKLAIILLLIFPTSFYFGSLYTESIFFALSVWSFFFARKRKWLIAGVLAGFAGATRIIGLALIAGLLVEWWNYSKADKDKKKAITSLSSILVSFLGIGSYLYYIYARTGDPFNFLTTVGIFGSQRSSSLILLPQVFYRYIFKVLPSLDYASFFSFFIPWLEFVTALIFTFISILSFFKLRLSYSIYLLLGFLIPTLSGSFSSLPRYVLVLFPAFILGAVYLNGVRKWRYLSITLMLISLFICTALFVRGFWVS